MKNLTEEDQKDLADFEALCKRIDTLDPKASEYLRDLADGYDPDAELGELCFLPGADLSKCFLWSEAPQGHGYWQELYGLLEAGKA